MPTTVTTYYSPKPHRNPYEFYKPFNTMEAFDRFVRGLTSYEDALEFVTGFIDSIFIKNTSLSYEESVLYAANMLRNRRSSLNDSQFIMLSRAVDYFKADID